MASYERRSITHEMCCLAPQYTTAKERNFNFFQSMDHVDVNLKLQFLIKSGSGYYIVPSPSAALAILLSFPRNFVFVAARARK